MRCYHCDIQQTTPSSRANQWQKSLTSKLTCVMESRVSQVSLAGVPDWPGDLVQRSSLQAHSSSLFITFGVTGCQTSVPRITVAALCFPERSVPYLGFFVLYPSRFFVLHPSGFLSLSCTHQDLCLTPIKVSLSFDCSLSGFQQSLSGCLRAPAKEMSFVSLFTSLCGS